MLQVNLVQLNIVWESPAENYERVESLLKQSCPEPDSLIVLPEMFPTGYSLNPDCHRYENTEPPQTFLSRIAKHFKCWVSGGAAVLGPDGNIRNQQLIVNPSGDCMARYSKIKLFRPGGEETLCQPGSEVVVASIGEWMTAPLVCYDLRFPELFRLGARRGAELFIVIANWPTVRLEHWYILLRARAIENQAYVIGVNRCGKDPDRDYPGHSIVVDPKGNILLDAGEEEVVTQIKLDRSSLLSWREEFPVLRDLSL